MSMHTMSRNRWIVACVAGALAVLVALVGTSPLSSNHPDVAMDGVRSAETDSAALDRNTSPHRGAIAALGAVDVSTGMQGRANLDHEALARSLRGTDVDGSLAVNDRGDLVLTIGVRDFFEYFLSTVGEVPLADVIGFIEAYARERLPARAHDQLMALLDDYLAYKHSTLALMQTELAPSVRQTPAYYLETLEHTFGELHKLRREHMAPDAVTAFFGAEEEYSRYTLDRMSIELDPALSAAEKAELMSHLRDDLSPALRRSEQRQIAHSERARAVQAILADDTDIEHKREALSTIHPPETVERIVAHVHDKQAFAARMTAYLAERQPIAVADLSTDQRASQIAALRARHFHTEQEQIWARTYEARLDAQ